jgi:sigma-B regulation protein RsbU (phosphoserine phosphatase)
MADSSELKRGGSGPRSSRSQPQGVLEIRHSPSGHVWFQPLTLPRLVLGRGPRADVNLEDETVSSPHAELVRGPYGQWWIHDLGSDTGTFVHGQRLTEQLLAAGDEVTLGVFRLRLLSRGSGQLARSPESGSPGTVRGGSLAPSPSPSPSKSPPGPTSSAPPPPSESVSSAPGNQIRAVHLSRVMALGRDLMQVEDAGARRRILCRFVVGDGFPADAAAVLRVQGPRTVRAIEGPLRRLGPNLPLYLADQVTGRLWELRQPVSASASPSRSSRASRPPGHVVSVCPLRVEEEFIEALYVELPPEFGGPEWCSMVAMVAEAFQQADLVWAMRSHVQQSSSVERELEMARQIQQGLVPQQARFDSLLQELDVVVGFEPCQWVGGDYVDAVPMPDGRVLLAIADVCGKGFQAALVASSLHTLVRATVDMDRPLSELVQRINRHMCRYLPDHVFVTMLCVATDLTTGELEVVSAGHPPALIAEASGRVWSLDVGHNIGLGIVDAEITSGTYSLGPDQVLLLYTDGLTEAMDEHGIVLGTERLALMFSRVASTHAGRGTHAMREALLGALRGFRGSLLANDDSTFLLARRRVSLCPPARE